MPLFTLEYERGLVNCQGSLMEYWDITSGGVANHPGGWGGERVAVPLFHAESQICSNKIGLTCSFNFLVI